jgi:hypothetical protein
LFKVSIFHYGASLFFLTQGEDGDGERERWIADIAACIGHLTQTLFPPYSMSTLPLMTAEWTATRLLAGYMVLCRGTEVYVAYCELRFHKDSEAAFVAYKDSSCVAPIVHCAITSNTPIVERLGVDCCCFNIDVHHLATRSIAEKTVWMRCISNLKTKIKCKCGDPSETVLEQYREAINEAIVKIRSPSDYTAHVALLPYSLDACVSQNVLGSIYSCEVSVDHYTDASAPVLNPSLLALALERASEMVCMTPCRNHADEAFPQAISDCNTRWFDGLIDLFNEACVA